MSTSSRPTCPTARRASCREHAPWALHDFGIRALVAPSFADIFCANCFKNGMLPVVLDAPTVDRLFALVGARPGLRLRIDLAAQTLTPEGAAPMDFEVEPQRKHRLLHGLDPIGLPLAKADTIRAYEARRRALEPWLFGPSTHPATTPPNGDITP